MKSFSIVFAIIFILLTRLSAQIGFRPFEQMNFYALTEWVSHADFNNDGRDDILVATRQALYGVNHSDEFQILILIQNTEGVLEKKFSFYYPFNSALRSIKIGDVNHDGLKDILLDNTNNVNIYTQNMTGGFALNQSLPCDALVEDIAIGDLNNDGFNDIAVCVRSDYTKIFYQKNDGSFDSKTVQNNGQVGDAKIEIADINADNRNDLILKSGFPTSELLVFKQLTNNQFSEPVVFLAPVNVFFNGLAVGDVNHDGKNDIVACYSANSPNAALFIWHQNSQNTLFDAPLRIKTYDIPEALTIYDVDCDGKNEIVLAHGGWQKVSVWAKNATDGYDEIVRLDIPHQSHHKSLALPKIGRNSKPDILVVGGGPTTELTGTIAVLQNTNEAPPLTIKETKINVIKTKQDTQTLTTTALRTIEKDSNKYRLITITKNTRLIKTFANQYWRRDTLKITTTIYCDYQQRDTLIRSFNFKDSTLLKTDSLVNIQKDTINFNVLSENLSDDIAIFPNPFSGIFYVKKKTTALVRPIDIELFAVNGQFIMRRKLTDILTEIDVPFLANGCYILSVQYEGQRFYKKLVNVY